MVKNVFEHNAILRKPTPLKRRMKLAPRLGVILLASLLAGCAHQSQIPTVGTVSVKRVQCWPKKISYSKRDTAPTIGQVREHNATGRNLGCWR